MSTATAELQRQADEAPAAEVTEQPAETHVLHQIVKELAARRREQFAEYRSLVARIAGGTAQDATIDEVEVLLKNVGVSLVQLQVDIERGHSNLTSSDGQGLRKFLTDRKHELEAEHLQLATGRHEILERPYRLRKALETIDKDNARELYRYFPDGTTPRGLEGRIERAGREIEEYEQKLLDTDSRLAALNRQREEISAELTAMSKQLNATR